MTYVRHQSKPEALVLNTGKMLTNKFYLMNYVKNLLKG